MVQSLDLEKDSRSKVLNHTVSHHALSDWLTDVVRSPPPTAS